METFLVTGGAGFIGVNFLRYALSHTQASIVVVDKLTYAGHRCSLKDLLDDPRVVFYQKDIADRDSMAMIFSKHQPSAVLNFAAETHVDRSIDDPRAFVETNVVGTSVLLSSAWHQFKQASSHSRSQFRFLHVSTDEVYGTLGATGLFTETSSYAPNSPYAATKAGADHLVRAYQETYGLPTLITNCSNNFGPYQYPEKLIPLMLLNGLDGKPLPIYGDGLHIRDWLFVEDHCEAILHILRHGRVGEKYNIGGHNERTNLEIVDGLCRSLETVAPALSNPALRRQGIQAYTNLKTFVSDRPGHDRRYALDTTKIRTELAWSPRHTFEEALTQTVHWYLNHRDWCEEVLTNTYGRERLGVAHKPVP